MNNQTLSARNERNVEEQMQLLLKGTVQKMEIDLESESFFGELKDWGGKLVDQIQIMETRNGFLK